ncbi:hypothetical protein [Nonomuraea sp. NPDC023979]|uniref:hypothetical protein n=1 Tax=Nonomuraea sp. NPDC023979 TaxID=3154796 RepID=UPI0033EEF5C6
MAGAIQVEGAELTDEELAALIVALVACSPAPPAGPAAARRPVPRAWETGYRSPRSWRTRA